MRRFIALGAFCVGFAGASMAQQPTPKSFAKGEKLAARQTDGLFCDDRNAVEMFIIAYYTHDNALLETLEGCRVLPNGTQIEVIADQTPQNGTERAHILNARILADEVTGYAVSSGFQAAARAPAVAATPPVATSLPAAQTPPLAPVPPAASSPAAEADAPPSPVTTADIPLPPRDPRRAPRRPKPPVPPGRPLDLNGANPTEPEN